MVLLLAVVPNAWMPNVTLYLYTALSGGPSTQFSWEVSKPKILSQETLEYISER